MSEKQQMSTQELLRSINVNRPYGLGERAIKLANVPQAIPVAPAVKEAQERAPKTFVEAYRKAVLLGIVGRSDMNKEQLLKAIGEAAVLHVKKAAPIVKAPPSLHDLLKRDNGFQKSLDDYAYISGGEKNIRTSKACFAGLQGVGAATEFVYNIRKNYNGDVDPQILEKWVDYIINRSPFAHVFLTKDAKQTIEHGVYIDCSQDFSEIVSGLIEMRQCWEHKTIVETMFKLVSLGVPERLAHMVSYFLSKKEGEWVFRWANFGHIAFGPTMNEKDLLKFFNKGFHVDKEKHPLNALGIHRYSIFDSIAKSIWKNPPAFSQFFNKIGKEKVDEYGGKLGVCFSERQLMFALGRLYEQMVTVE